MKVWNMTHYCIDSTGKRGQHHVYVVAHNQKEAAGLLGTTVYDLKKYGSPCGGRFDEFLLAQPDPCVFIVDGDSSRYVPDASHLQPARVVGNVLTVVED